MTDTSAPIDPHRPWIRDKRDDPSGMNWVETLFNPLGMTGKLHFSRAWTFMFMGRVLIFIVPVFSVFIGGVAGADLDSAWKPVSFLILPIPALLVPFFIFTIVTEFTSWVAHVRRLAEANRSTLKAMIVLIPLILGLIGFAGGVSMGIAQHRAQAAKSAPAAEATVTEAGANAPVAQQNGQAKQGQRHGPPPTERQMAIGTGMSIGVMLWAIASFVVMLWTLLHVARLPNGGVGAFRTGSDLSQEAQTPRTYEAAV